MNETHTEMHAMNQSSRFPFRVALLIVAGGLLALLSMQMASPSNARSAQPSWTPHKVEMNYKVLRFDWDTAYEGLSFQAPWRFTFRCQDRACTVVRTGFWLHVDKFGYGLFFKPRTKVDGKKPLSQVVWKSSKYVSSYWYGCSNPRERIYGLRFSVKLRMIQLPSRGNVVRWKIVGTHREANAKFKKGQVSKKCQKELINDGLKLGHRPTEVYRTTGIARARI